MKTGSSATTASFDRIADVYRWAEYLALGSMLVKTRNHLLPSLLNKRNALAFGDGDGRFLAALLRQNPTLRATAVDTSGRMLTLLRRRCQNEKDRLCTVQASALSIAPSADTDLIITHFFLDCLSQPDVERLVREVASNVDPGTRWLVSDFAVPKCSILEHVARAYIRVLYFAFRLLTNLRTQSLPDIPMPLERAGFQRVARKEFLWGFLYTELWELQHPLRAQQRATTDRMESSTLCG